MAAWWHTASTPRSAAVTAAGSLTSAWIRGASENAGGTACAEGSRASRTTGSWPPAGGGGGGGGAGAAGGEAGDDVGADEARAAGDEYAHAATLGADDLG